MISVQPWFFCWGLRKSCCISRAKQVWKTIFLYVEMMVGGKLINWNCVSEGYSACSENQIQLMLLQVKLLMSFKILSLAFLKCLSDCIHNLKDCICPCIGCCEVQYLKTIIFCVINSFFMHGKLVRRKYCCYINIANNKFHCEILWMEV